MSVFTIKAYCICCGREINEANTHACVMCKEIQREEYNHFIKEKQKIYENGWKKLQKI